MKLEAVSTGSNLMPRRFLCITKKSKKVKITFLKLFLFRKTRSADLQIISSENSWDDIQRSEAHRRVLQGEILSHFRESTAGDTQMEALRAEFAAAIDHFKTRGHAWLKPQELVTRLSTVKMTNTRNEFERRFIYHNPQLVRIKKIFLISNYLKLIKK